MSSAAVDRIAAALLYEGYILYPYRPSVKNRQRWTFGGLYPESYCRQPNGADSSSNQTEVLVHGTEATILEVNVRFLHLTDRLVGRCEPPLETWSECPEPAYAIVESLRVGDKGFFPWQEAEGRNVTSGPISLGRLVAGMRQKCFTYPSRRWLEPLPGPDGKTAGVLLRRQQSVVGSVGLQAFPLANGLWKVAVQVWNHTPLGDEMRTNRDEALLRSLISTHTILSVQEGEFMSLLDPPESCREAAAACHNIGTWPVLVGADGEGHTMLSSPIILYDYPRVAPESPGDLFDGAEIDEILSLRIMTLTDDEKQTMAAIDGRARALLDRTEKLGREQLMRLHGTIRSPAGEAADD